MRATVQGDGVEPRAAHPADCPCRLCWLAAKARGEARPWARAAPKPRPKSVPLVVRPPCAHEGPVVEWCKTCTGAMAENRHVRQCLLDLPGWEVEACVRGRGANPEVQSCALCPHHRAAG